MFLNTCKKEVEKITNLISNWLLNVVGIVIVGVLVEIIMPHGKMTKFVKCLVGIFTILVIISPLKNIDFNNINIDYLTSSTKIDNNYVEKMENNKLEALKIDIKKSLNENGFYNINIEFEIDENNNINTIYVDLKNLVLIDANMNINKYTNIMAIINKFVFLNKENFVFYE